GHLLVPPGVGDLLGRVDDLAEVEPYPAAHEPAPSLRQPLTRPPGPSAAATPIGSTTFPGEPASRPRSALPNGTPPGCGGAHRTYGRPTGCCRACRQRRRPPPTRPSPPDD